MPSPELVEHVTSPGFGESLAGIVGVMVAYGVAKFAAGSLVKRMHLIPQAQESHDQTPDNPHIVDDREVALANRVEQPPIN